MANLSKEKFAEHCDEEVGIDKIIEFMKGKKLGNLGALNEPCDICGANFYELYREELDIPEDWGIEGEWMDFAVYVCSKCGTWSTYIEIQ